MGLFLQKKKKLIFGTDSNVTFKKIYLFTFVDFRVLDVSRDKLELNLKSFS